MTARHLIRRAADVTSPLFLVGYFIYLVPAYRTIGSALLVPGLVVLVAAGWRNTSTFSRCYLAVAVALAAASVAVSPFDGRRLAASVASLATIVGLVVVLRTIGFPILADQYREAIAATLTLLRRRRLREPFTPALVGLSLGQILAFAVVPVADQILGVTDPDSSRRTSRWSGRGLSVTVLSAVAFPTVSVVIDILDISVTAYLAYALPITLLFAAVVLIRTARRARGVDGEAEPATEPLARPALARPLLEIAGYLLSFVLLVIVLSSVVHDVSYLAIVSAAGLACSVVASVVLAARGQAAPVTALRQYGRDWWRQVGSEVYVFTGGGFLLYFLVQCGLLDSLPRTLIKITASTPGAVYVVSSLSVFALFMVGVHPTVSTFVISLAVATSADAAASVSLPLLALSLMLGNVAGLMPSPFSALSNIRAALSRMDVLQAFRENIGFGFTLLVVGNAYVLLLAAVHH